jgi:hypothetical protein
MGVAEQRVLHAFAPLRIGKGPSHMLQPAPSRLLEDLKTFLYPYIVIGPLISALFANSIDNLFAACLAFVAFVGTAFYWFNKRVQLLEDAVRDMEKRLHELEKRAGDEG